MKKIKHIIAALLIAVFALAPTPALAAKCPSGAVLTFPAWYKNLDCVGKQPKITKINDVWIIGLNIVEMLIGAAAYVAAGFIIWGGVKYIKSQGEPGKTAEAKTAILQAVIGLGIALASTAIVIFIGSQISA